MLGNGTLHHVLDFGRNALEASQNNVDLVLTEAEDHEEGLEGDLNNGLSDEGRTEEDAERDQEVATEETCQVEQGVRNLFIVKAK